MHSNRIRTARFSDCLFAGVSAQGGVCPGVSTQGGVSAQGGVWHTPPCGQRYACENITSTLWAAIFSEFCAFQLS